MRFFRVEVGDTDLLFLLFVFHISLLVFLFPKVGSRVPLLFGMGGEQASPSYFFLILFFFYSFVLLLCGFLRENRRTVAQKSADRHSRAKGFCGTKKL